jgi:hypothetical protein
MFVLARTRGADALSVAPAAGRHNAFGGREVEDNRTGRPSRGDYIWNQKQFLPRNRIMTRSDYN